MVVADSVLSAADVVTYQTLAGGLSRETPRLYRVVNGVNDVPADSYALWLQQLVQNNQVRINTTYLNDFPGVVKMFSNEIKGYVTFNVSSESVNAAITFCAASSDLVVAAGSDNMTTLFNALGVPLVRDLTNATVEQVYQEVKGGLRLRGVSFQPPSKSGNLAEYAVFARIPTLEYVGNDGGALALQIMHDIQAQGSNGFALGWGPEGPYVSTLGEHNIYVHASDWSKDVPSLANLHVHSNTKTHFSGLPQSNVKQHLLQKQEQERQKPAVPNTHTVAFLMTDGDNIQWLLNNWATDESWFGSSQRGEVPIGWTISPGLVSLAPLVLNYAQQHATSNDSFVSGPSGLGYIYPTDYNDNTGFAMYTNEYFQQAGLDIVNVIDDNMFSLNLHALLDQSNVSAMFLYTGDCYAGPAGLMGWYNNKPVITGRAALWGSGTTGQCLDVDALVQRLIQLPRDPTKASGYSLIPVHAWTHNVSDIVRAAQALMDAGLSVVHPTEFVARIMENVTNKCNVPEGSYMDSCNDCTIDDNCILTCNCNAPKGTISTSCNLDCCSFLSNNNGRLWCEDGACPSSC
eukprot:m.202133 g.202133  ORF g.202133 m.202133 type:complete len:573 (+) comp16872_c5_seq2:10808-12526(+)